MLVSSMVGLDNRATMDIDTTIRNFPLDEDHAREIVEKIAAVEIDDNIRFSVKDVSTIMDEAEYGGVRLSLDAFLDTMKIPLKIDISTGDAITPAEIEYHYKLMFEQRYISLWAYPLETVLAEKMETILSRGVLNTRLRDFYDLYILQQTEKRIDRNTLSAALAATCRKRESETILPEYGRTLDEIYTSRAPSLPFLLSCLSLFLLFRALRPHPQKSDPHSALPYEYILGKEQSALAFSLHCSYSKAANYPLNGDFSKFLLP